MTKASQTARSRWGRYALLLATLAAFALLLGGMALPRSGRAATSTNFLRGTVTGSGFTTIKPTAIAIGPDGRLYVADLVGRIQALTLDPASKAVIAIEQVASSTDLQEVFGIAFDPTDASFPPPVYVSNTLSGSVFGPDGLAPDGSYPGKITKIDGPGYANKTDIITGLPVSNFLHQANGLVFAADGTLYIAHGGMTNAGLPGVPFLRAEVPLSGAVLVANPSAPGFDGNITYDPPAPNVYATTVDQVSGDVSVYASGLRNPYDLIIHSNGRIYLTDNGPGGNDGDASTGCDSQTKNPWGEEHPPDELNIIEEGNYYGHPNRNRGRFDPRQCVYHNGTEGSGPDWTGPIALLPPSSNGIVEYTASTFDGKLLGNLFYVGLAGVLGRVVLSPDGSSVVSHTENFASGFANPLDITMSADGTLFIAEFDITNMGLDKITFLRPPTKQPFPADTDGDGCSDQRENGPDEKLGGMRDYLNPNDFYDINGDGIIDLFNDVLGVINHYSLDGSPPYDANFDRGPSAGPNPWNMTAPDGVIDLFTDILGVIQQHGHACR